ncbi:hypothetical protein D9M73_156410 [compost metagenome]
MRRDQAFGHARAAGGGDGVDQDVVLAAFDGQGAGQAVETELGHAVVGLAEIAIDTRGRRGENHPAVVLLAHMWPGGTGDFVGTFDVDAVNQVPVGVIHFVEGLVPQDPGIVDHHVDATEDVQGVLDQFVTVSDRVVVGFGNAAGLANLRDHAVGGRGIGAFALGRAAKIVDQHPGALFGEQQCMRPSQADTGSGDDHDFIFEAHRLIHGGDSSRPRDSESEFQARRSRSQ